MEETEELIENVKERRMGQLFDGMEKTDIQEAQEKVDKYWKIE